MVGDPATKAKTFPIASMSIGGVLQGGPRNAPPLGAPGNVAGGRNIGSRANKLKANIAAKCNTKAEVVRNQYEAQRPGRQQEVRQDRG
ncbi:hypothetical protein DL766_007582 [Monosporascus sp. MC13-8B]|uniref:Uncharacterized protein n=1 Tax=Monosporascus cannonballus TaxID=155416 RepID=A0ABY0HIZ4_9PEZI|nr:hypothetical protein DL763_008201 [Monosporascus cannonballus]RYO94557.1 hypothetical protein DL762_000449 [Monosporascus cannonballus]RYP22989.1 hypothetical protein DL766_007582 [Monosporascus sp. MC13-8B]